MIRILFLTLIFATSTVWANEINMTPQGSFSGYYNKSTYSPVKRPISQYNYQDNRANIMKAKSIHEMGDINPTNNGKSPMTYNQFPQNYDSSNSMMMMQGVQNGLQNTFMGY